MDLRASTVAPYGAYSSAMNKSLLLVAFVTTAVAQDETGRSDGVPTCTASASASRTRAACGEEEQIVLSVEKELTISLELAAPNDQQCETEIAVEYFQRDTIARVTGLIENETCAASSGQYEIAIRIEDENGELKTLEFSESWLRDDNQSVAFTADYPVGENVEVIRLRSQGLRCTCSDTIEE
jgi:hypothetical protein